MIKNTTINNLIHRQLNNNNNTGHKKKVRGPSKKNKNSHSLSILYTIILILHLKKDLSSNKYLAHFFKISKYIQTHTKTTQLTKSSQNHFPTLTPGYFWDSFIIIIMLFHFNFIFLSFQFLNSKNPVAFGLCIFRLKSKRLCSPEKNQR